MLSRTGFTESELAILMTQFCANKGKAGHWDTDDVHKATPSHKVVSLKNDTKEIFVLVLTNCVLKWRTGAGFVHSSAQTLIRVALQRLRSQQRLHQ